LTDTALIIHPVLSLQAGGNSTRRNRRIEDVLEEAESLVHAIHMEVCSTHVAKVSRVNPGYYLGKGTVERLAEIIEEEEPSVVIVNERLSPVQQRNLEKAFNAKVIDRTGIILEIFGARAQTKEGKIQVDLALLEYQKSRLVRSWTHLERQRGGGGFLGGPGEAQIELDRRYIQEKINQLKKELEQVRRTRELSRKSREKVPFPIVALVGYTNAGKSTLFNKLTGADVFVEDLVFATLDPTLRRLELPTGEIVIISDTVGFIADLPTTLVEAFRATLEQVQYADIILHVRDISSPDAQWQKEDVIKVLSELDIKYTEDPRIFEVLNKIDAVEHEGLSDVKRLANFSADKVIPVSARTGEGLEQMLEAIAAHISQSNKVHEYVIPAHDGRAIAWLNQEGEIVEQGMSEDGQSLVVKVRLSGDNHGRFETRFKYNED
jgi:GTP-binding protein HflX